MTTLILDNLNPRRLVSANQRIHHMVRAEVCAYWRRLATEAALAAHLEQLERIHVTLTFRFPTNQRRDVGNLYPYVAKPLVDGLVDAHVIPDDDDRHCVGPDLRRDPEKGTPRIVVDIVDLLAPEHCAEAARDALAEQQRRLGVAG